MPVCEFFGCDSGSKKKSLVKNPQIMLYRFPKDLVKRDCLNKQITFGQNIIDRKK